MNEVIEALREAKRIRLLATALELMRYEGTDSAVIPIPGAAPQRYVTVGTAATVAKLLEIDQVGASASSLADDSRFRQMMQEFLMGQVTVDQVAERLEEWRAGLPRLPLTGMD